MTSLGFIVLRHVNSSVTEFSGVRFKRKIHPCAKILQAAEQVD